MKEAVEYVAIVHVKHRPGYGVAESLRLFNPMRRFLQLLLLCSPEALGIRMIEAAEAFDTPPVNQSARRYAIAATCFLLGGSALLVAAALIDAIGNNRQLSETFGWCGLGCLVVCVYSGLRYKETNKCTSATNDEEPTEY